MLQYTLKRIVDCSDWDDLVEKTYGKQYCFQQQNGCQPRGIFNLTIPSNWNDDFKNETLKGREGRGIKFSVWLDTDFDSKQQIDWYRNFYPGIQTVANDLYEKGLIEPGDYTINIDW